MFNCPSFIVRATPLLTYDQEDSIEFPSSNSYTVNIELKQNFIYINLNPHNTKKNT